jgi:selenocysteine lyase/cysteine desulfurase
MLEGLIATGRHTAGGSRPLGIDVEGLSPGAVVNRLRERRIIASVAPYAVPHVRLTPCIQNTPAEIDTVLQEIRALVS